MSIARKPATAPRVDQDLVSRLLRLVNLIAKPFFAEYASRFQLSINDWRVLMTLAQNPELAASDICEQTGMHPMNVSRSVAHLERLRRVKRCADPKDRRRSLLRLTRTGRAVFRSIAPSAQAREEVVRRALSAREAAVLRTLLDRLIARVGAETNDSSQPAARKRVARRLRINLR
ncbi:MAG: winged helix-turn-helix transcriptional regulator [Betaproteobacteria bacterium]|nr:winged helix-turn-helix transcriptional regulator [Betaproteobacteria bacterium]